MKNYLSAILLKLQKKWKLKLFLLGSINFFASSPYSVLPILFTSFSLFFLETENDFLYRKLIKAKTEGKYNYINFFKKCFYFFSGYVLSQFYWLVHPLTSDISSFWFLVPFAFLLPIVILSPLFSLAILIYKFCINKFKINNLTLKIILFTSFFICAEYLRGNYLFNGFPWQVFGYFFSYAPFLQILPKFMNIYIFSFIFFLIVLTPVIYFHKKKTKGDKIFFYLLLFFFVFNFLFGLFKISFSLQERYNILFFGIQPNISAKEKLKMNPYKTLGIAINEMQINTKKTTLNSIYMMPEDMIKFPLENKGELSVILGNLLPNDSSVLVAGGTFFEEMKNKVYNVIYFLNKNGTLLGVYKKRNLVPFGEYIPFRKLLPKKFITAIAGESDFAIENENDDAVMYQNLPIMIPAVCYDIIFTEQFFKIKEKFQYKNKPQVIINLTNDVWAGNTNSPYQHLAMAQWTAARLNLPVIRLSNNGISAFIDKNGKIMMKTLFNKKDIFVTFF